MNGAFYVGGIGLTSQQNALDVLANNITNINTRSFKRSSVRFSEMIAGRGINGLDLDAKVSSPQMTAVAGVSTNVSLMLNEQGQLETTGRPLDVAIEGEGFIELLGPRGQMLLWRGGTLHVNDEGLLAADNGLVLKAMINVPQDASAVEFATDGTVSILTETESDPVILGQIMVVRMTDASNVERLDGGVYNIKDGRGIVDAVPGEDGAGHLVQGAIERSNVDLNNEMVQMMIVQRAYAANAQIVQAADQIMSIVNNLRR